MRQISQTLIIDGRRTTLFADTSELGIVLQVLIGKPNDAPHIRYDEILLRAFDNQKKETPVKKRDPKAELYSESRLAGTTAGGVYSIVLERNRVLSTVELSQDGKTYTFQFSK